MANSRLKKSGANMQVKVGAWKPLGKYRKIVKRAGWKRADLQRDIEASNEASPQTHLKQLWDKVWVFSSDCEKAHLNLQLS